MFQRVYVTMGALLGTAGGVIGVGAAWLLAFGAHALAEPLSIPMPAPSILPVELVLLALLAVGAAVLAAAWALRQASRVSVREALAAP